MENQPHYPFWQFIKDVAHYIKPYKKIFWSGVFFRVTSDITNLFPAFAISQIVLLLTNQPPNLESTILILLLIWACVTIYYSVAHNIAKYFGYQVAEKAGLDLYKQCLTHVLRLDLTWQEKENSGNKMKRMEKGYEGIDQLVRRIFDMIIEVIINIVGIVVIFFTLKQTALSFALIFFIISYFILGTSLLKRAIKQEKVVNKKAEDLGGLTFEALNNIQTIKALAINNGIAKTIQTQTNLLFKEIKKRIIYFRTQNAAIISYEMIFEFIVVCVLIWQIMQGHIQISILVLFMGLFSKVATSTREMTQVTQDIILSKIWISRAMQILHTKPVIEHPNKEELEYPARWKTLTLDNISFSYPGGDALKNISLTIHRGEKIGIVGLSGAGKSTLFKLLLDLYEDYEGDIRLDTTSFKSMNRQSFINNVSVVLQDTELFNLSLKENITIAQTDTQKLVNIDKIIDMAHLTDVVAKLPNGLETLVGEKGIKLSGGQRQRVGIARALFRQPDILLMDEATSHLDAYSEKQIQQALHESMHRFTTIVIAHRLSTIKEMDRIVVLEKGIIKEIGTFDQLLKKNGAFAKMWKEQKL